MHDLVLQSHEVLPFVVDQGDGGGRRRSTGKGNVRSRPSVLAAALAVSALLCSRPVRWKLFGRAWEVLLYAGLERDATREDDRGILGPQPN